MEIHALKPKITGTATGGLVLGHYPITEFETAGNLALA